jgi:hypothetical protein
MQDVIHNLIPAVEAIVYADDEEKLEEKRLRFVRSLSRQLLMLDAPVQETHIPLTLSHQYDTALALVKYAVRRVDMAYFVRRFLPLMSLLLLEMKHACRRCELEVVDSRTGKLASYRYFLLDKFTDTLADKCWACIYSGCYRRADVDPARAALLYTCILTCGAGQAFARLESLLSRLMDDFLNSCGGRFEKIEDEASTTICWAASFLLRLAAEMDSPLTTVFSADHPLVRSFEILKSGSLSVTRDADRRPSMRPVLNRGQIFWMYLQDRVRCDAIRLSGRLRPHFSYYRDVLGNVNLLGYQPVRCLWYVQRGLFPHGAIVQEGARQMEGWFYVPADSLSAASADERPHSALVHFLLKKFAFDGNYCPAVWNAIFSFMPLWQRIIVMHTCKQLMKIGQLVPLQLTVADVHSLDWLEYLCAHFDSLSYETVSAPSAASESPSADHKHVRSISALADRAPRRMPTLTIGTGSPLRRAHDIL